MLFRIFFTGVLIISIAIMGFSQSIVYILTPIPLNNLDAFATPAKQWKIVGGLEGDFTTTQPKDTRGTGILYNDFKDKNLGKKEANLRTKLEHGNMVLSMDFLLPKGAKSGVLLQGRYEVQLADSWGTVFPTLTDNAGIDAGHSETGQSFAGQAPVINASLAPNLWQHLEIEFQAPRFNENGRKIQPARFVRVILNGQTVHENVIVSSPTQASAFTNEQAKGPLVLQGDQGIVAFKNIEYALLNDFKVTVSDLSYDYYEGDFDNDFAAVKPADKVRSGKAEQIDIRYAADPNNMYIAFDGKLQIEEDAPYQFVLRKKGVARLSIDGKELIAPDDDLFADQVATKTLSPGTHTFTVGYIKNFSWAPSGLGLFISKENTRPMPLHHPASLPNETPPPLIQVEATQEPRVHRSFMNFEGKKKTDIISVGDPTGINFAYDLDQAALLQMWRGDFLNATDMWYERGEPQTASPMGATIVVSNHCPVAMATGDQPLPDTLSSQDLVYKGYTLNKQRQPEFSYTLKGTSFTDLFQPDATGKGLTRTLRLEDVPKDQTVTVRLAAGDTITQVADNVYAINDQAYYLQLEPSMAKLTPEVKTTANGKELIVRLGADTHTLSYTLLW